MHTYLIKDAIKDGNVLGFSVDYMKFVDYNSNQTEEDVMVEGIDTEEVFMKSKHPIRHRSSSQESAVASKVQEVWKVVAMHRS